VFNILCGNTDDHARNHAAFWNGKSLQLTPAYDICPQGRTGGEASQAMLLVGSKRLSQLTVCIEAAPNFLLPPDRASAIIKRQIETITSAWDSVCDEAGLSQIDRAFLWGRQFLNPYALEGLPDDF
jgi:serine/threonine-protein kinase HipA